jgi:hypothetical protein
MVKRINKGEKLSIRADNSAERLWQDMQGAQEIIIRGLPPSIDFLSFFRLSEIIYIGELTRTLPNVRSMTLETPFLRTIEWLRNKPYQDLQHHFLFHALLFATTPAKLTIHAPGTELHAKLNSSYRNFLLPYPRICEMQEKAQLFARWKAISQTVMNRMRFQEEEIIIMDEKPEFVRRIQMAWRRCDAEYDQVRTSAGLGRDWTCLSKGDQRCWGSYSFKVVKCGAMCSIYYQVGDARERIDEADMFNRIDSGFSRRAVDVCSFQAVKMPILVEVS